MCVFMLCYAMLMLMSCLAAAWQLPTSLWKFFYGFGVKVASFWDQFLILLEAVGNNFGALDSRCPPGDFQDPPGSV